MTATADPRPYQTAARYYHARPPYSAHLREALTARLGWDGTGRLLDVGCGPGVVALALSDSFQEVVGLDPEESMLAEARASSKSRSSLQWVKGRAEEIPHLNLGTFQAVSLGQSFHWTDRETVADIVYGCLRPGGAMLLIHHERPVYRDPEKLPTGPGHPAIPHDAIDSLLIRYLGHGKPPPDPNREPYSELLARTRFGASERLVLPGRDDLVRSINDVINNYLSASFAAPQLFGEHLEEFRAELGRVLAQHTTTGFFWEWPGDTEVLIAIKPERTSP